MPSDPFSVVAATIVSVIGDEFSDEGIKAYRDRVHDALGTDGIEVGVEPVRWARQARNANVRETFARIRFYDLWEKQIDPTQQVDPSRITGFADRFCRRLDAQTGSAAGTDEVWYFDVLSVEFPDDPTGNKTRFVADVRAVGTNPAFAA